MANKEYEIGFKIAADMESDFIRTFSSAAKSVEGVEKELKALQQQKGPGDRTKELRDGLRKTEESFEGAEKSASGFRDTLKRVAEYTGAYQLVTGVTDAFTNIIGTIGDYQSSMKHVQAATGASVADMAQMKKMAVELYKQNMGENFQDLADAIAKAKQFTDLEGEALERTTKDAIVFRDVFGQDIAESLRTVDTMMINFGITSKQAFNLLAQGAQKGLDKSGELLDTANEYTPYFAKLGFSANQMFDTFSAGLKAGAFNLDKVGDGIKEFGIRSKDGSKQTLEAYQALKLDGEEMTQQFAEGGETAQKAFLTTVKAISELKDPVEQNTVSVQLFGTQAEDLEARVIKAYGNVQKQFDMTKDTMEEIADIQYDTTVLSFQGLGRELMTELVLPIGTELLPTLNHLSDWLIDNKGLIKNLALLVPAALIGKSVAKIAGGIAEIGTAASAGGKSVGMLQASLGLFTNPAGLAVAAIGAVTLGVLEYRRHQEEARQSLIHMSEELQQTAKNYKGVADRAAETRALANEYDVLSAKISQNKDASNSLTAEKQRLEEVTKRLQELHPNTITQYDIETGKLKEKVGLAKQEADAEKELAKLKLEREIADKSRDVPKLEKELASLEKQTASLKAQKDALDAAIPAIKQYEAEYQRILATDPTEERAERLQELLRKVNEVGNTVGLNFAHLANLPGTADDLNTNLVGVIDKLVKKSEELSAARTSYDELYNAQKKLIELNLGATLDEQATKFKSLSEEEKARFQAAVKSVNELNKEMDLLPTDKKIKVQVVYEEMGLGPIPKFSGLGSLSAVSDEKYAKQVQELRNFPTFEKGGVATEPSIFGEAGPEMAIPLNNSRRSHELLEATNRMMGHSPGPSTTVEVTRPFSFDKSLPEMVIPERNSRRSLELSEATNRMMGSSSEPGINFGGFQYTIVVNGKADKEEVKQGVQAAHEDFEKRYRNMKLQKERVSMGV